MEVDSRVAVGLLWFLPARSLATCLAPCNTYRHRKEGAVSMQDDLAYHTMAPG